MVASAVLVECTRGVNLRMASADVEAAQLFLRQQDVKERRLQRLIKSADLKMVGLQDGLRMREEEIIAVEKSEAADKTEQLERLAGIQDALTIDLEPLQLHSADLQRQLHELHMASLSAGESATLKSTEGSETWLIGLRYRDNVTFLALRFTPRGRDVSRRRARDTN